LEENRNANCGRSTKHRPVSALSPAHTQVSRMPLGVPHGFRTTAFPTPRPINCNQTRQTEGRDVSMRKTGNSRPVLICPCVVTASPLLVRAGHAGLAKIHSARRPSSQTPPLVRRPRRGTPGPPFAGELLHPSCPCRPLLSPWSPGGAGANIFSMLEEEEVALARAELHVIEARGRVSDQLAKIARLKSFDESSLEAEHDLGLFEVYLLIVERHRDFLVRSQQQRPNKT
jgi:hypothetical protein